MVKYTQAIRREQRLKGYSNVNRHLILLQSDSLEVGLGIIVKFRS